MIRWETCKRDFEPDGALRDIYVCGTAIDDWRALFEVLRTTFGLEYLLDGVSRPVPATVDEAFTIRDSASPTLNFAVGDIIVTCHFFVANEIEFDISP